MIDRGKHKLVQSLTLVIHMRPAAYKHASFPDSPLPPTTPIPLHQRQRPALPLHPPRTHTATLPLPTHSLRRPHSLPRGYYPTPHSLHPPHPTQPSSPPTTTISSATPQSTTTTTTTDTANGASCRGFNGTATEQEEELAAAAAGATRAAEARPAAAVGGMEGGPQCPHVSHPAPGLQTYREDAREARRRRQGT